MEIQVEVRNVYGVEKVYPVNAAAAHLAMIAGRKTLDARQLMLAGKLGHQVVEMHGAKLPAMLAQVAA